MTTQFRLPDDLKNTLAKDQWWLLNTGQKVRNYRKVNDKEVENSPGIDLNVLPLWPFYTGKGITVGVVDDGIDLQNKDLPATGAAPKGPGDNHGTNVAGIIGALRNNLGTVGIAYEATISSYNKDRDSSLEEQEKLDVSNNSWGGSKHFQQENIPGVISSATKGRNGLGTVFVWSGGNERTDINEDENLQGAAKRGRNVNSGNYESNRYVIAVAALDNKGVVTSYSNPGAPLLVSAFGSEFPQSIATVDRSENEGNNTDKNKR